MGMRDGSQCHPAVGGSGHGGVGTVQHEPSEDSNGGAYSRAPPLPADQIWTYLA